MQNRIRVAVVDDHALFRKGVALTLGNAPDMEMVDEGATAQDAISICRTQNPDIVLLDIGIPGSGIEAARQVLQSYGTVKVVILTASDDEDDILASQQLGVSAYILKRSSGPELLGVLRGVQNGAQDVAPALAMAAPSRSKQPVTPPAGQSGNAKLTHREEQVIGLLSKGLTNKEAAFLLHVSERTIKYFVAVIMKKLQARDRLEAVLIARKWYDA